VLLGIEEEVTGEPEPMVIIVGKTVELGEMDSPPSNTTKVTETPWVELFEWSSGSFYGSVNTIEKAAELIDLDILHPHTCH
jgi:hypothetical protein